MRALLYLYDPLCGWCYAATSGIARLLAANGCTAVSEGANMPTDF